MQLQIAFQNVGVNLSDTVDGMRSDDSKVSHVDTFALVLFNQGHTAETIVFSGEMLGHILNFDEKRKNLWNLLKCFD